MLLRLILLRMSPLISLRFCKNREQIKRAVWFLLICYGLCLLLAVWKLFSQEKWMGIIYLPLALFPHYLCYGFAIWMILRCILGAWSERVWKRIFSLSILSIALGILSENYWNPKILQFFFEILN